MGVVVMRERKVHQVHCENGLLVAGGWVSGCSFCSAIPWPHTCAILWVWLDNFHYAFHLSYLTVFAWAWSRIR